VRVTDLAPSTTYTFSVHGRDARGNLSEQAATHTTVTRTPGVYVQENRHPGRARVTSRAPRSGGDPLDSALAVNPADGRVHLAYLVRNSPDPSDYFGPADVFYATRLPTGRWSSATRIASGPVGDVTLSRRATGTLALSWRDGTRGGCWRTKRPGSTWSLATCRTLPQGTRQVVLDRFNRLHIIEDRITGPSGERGLWYRSNAAGRWTGQRVLGAGNLISRLTIDPVTDQVVLVVGRQVTYPKWRIEVARKSAKSSRLGRLSTWAMSSQQEMLLPTSVTSYGGRVTIGLRRARPGGFEPRESYGAPRVVTGTNAGDVTRVTAAMGTSAADSQLVVAAESRNRVLLAWARRGAAVDDAAAGIWVSRGVLSNGRWSFTPPSQRTRSAFDALTPRAEIVTWVPSVLASDGRGSIYLAFRRMASDEERAHNAPPLPVVQP
jgi:hypothetical protein